MDTKDLVKIPGGTGGSNFVMNSMRGPGWACIEASSGVTSVLSGISSVLKEKYL